MASIKSLAAIGLMMVIVVPIGLGYMLAVDEGETTGWKTVERSNISDLLLNSSTDYYTDYTGPANNSMVLVTKYSPGAGTYSILESPSYVSVGDTYSSIPEYVTSSGSKALASSTVRTYSGTADLGYGEDYSDRIASAPWISVAISSSATAIHWSFEYDNQSVLTKDPILLIRSDGSKWTAYCDALPDGSAVCSTWGVVSDVSGTVTVTSRDYAAVDMAGSWTTELQDYGLKLTKQGGSIEYVTGSGVMQTITYSSGGALMVGGTAYSKVTGVSLVTSAGYTALPYTSIILTGRYADPSSGWAAPEGTATYWINGMTNKSATLMIEIPSGTVTLSKLSSGQSSAQLLEIKRTDGTVTVGGTVLGSYRYLSVVADMDGYTVTGITAWPTMGESAIGLNSVTVAAKGQAFERLKIGGDTAYYRVDSAEILAGSYASTKDYTLDLGTLYPGKSSMVELTNIGVYGSALTIGGTEYTVTDGKITVDSKTYGLKGIKITFLGSDEGYSVSLNGTDIGTVPSATVTYAGEWSMGAVLYTLELTTIKTMEWIPGGYSLDKTGICAAGLICCVITFLAVGLTGQRSGPKIALLGIIVGGAALTYLVMV